MAGNTLGSLVIRVGLDLAEVTTGFTKADHEARKWAQSLDRGIKTAVNAATIALAGMTTGALAALTAVDQLAKQAGNFQDLAEKTGANAEALASFSVAAQVAGTNIESVADASVKLTKNLTGVDDESKAAGAALAALGIPLKEFKALDPASQIEAVAKAMAGFDDGASKVAVSLALFGKSGAQLLPFLKELAQEGGRQVILTQEQIRLADEYSDKQAKARAELNLYAQVLATQALPAITTVISITKELVGELIGVDKAGKNLRDSNAVAEFANNCVRALAFIADSADSVSRIFRVVGNVIGATAAQVGALAEGDLKRYNAIQKDASDVIDGIISKQTIRFRLEKNIADQAANAKLKAVEDRGFTPAGRPLVFSGAEAKAKAEATSESQRYIDSLTKTLERTQDLTAQEQVWLDFSLGRIKGMTEAQFKEADSIARQIDANKQLKKEQEDAKRLAEDEMRTRERISAMATKAIEQAQQEAAQMREQNTAFEDQLAQLKGGEEALHKLTDARLAKTIADKEDLKTTLQLSEGNELMVKAIQEQIDALRNRQALIANIDFAATLKKEAEAAQEVKNALSDTFANAFADVVTGAKSAKDALRSFFDDLSRQLARLATQNIANAIFGGNNSGGPDYFGMLMKLGFSLFGGSTYLGGVTDSVPMDIGLGANAMGTRSWRGGWTTVGERGKELVNLPTGAQVVPNHEIGSMGGGQVINQTINVLPGATRQTGYQAAREAARQVTGAVKR